MVAGIIFFITGIIWAAQGNAPLAMLFIILGVVNCELAQSTKS